MKKKTCRKCLETKRIKMFVAEKRNKDGMTNICKACRNDALRSKSSTKRRYIGKLDQECSKCKEIKLLNEFQRCKTTKNGRLARCKACKPKDPKSFKAYWRLMEKQKLYDIPIEITKEDVAMIFKMFEGRCAYCYAQESDDTRTFELEHIIPMSNTEKCKHAAFNLCISCKYCNVKKSNKPLITFYRSHEPFTSQMLDFLFIYIAYFSGREVEEVALEFYAEVENG